MSRLRSPARGIEAARPTPGSNCTAGAARRSSARHDAAREVALELGRLVGLERAEHVGGDVVAPALVLGLVHASPSASSPRIFSSPSRIRPFTVPSGTPSISAISEWLKPPK